MKTLYMLLLLLALPTQASPQTWSTPNFEIHYQKNQTTPEEAQAVGQHAEIFFERLETYLGRSLHRKLTISLEGNRGDDPKHRWAYVDDTAGWIHLFRFPEDTFPYQTGLSHEMVHAFRFEHLSSIELPPSQAFVFLEEGLAEHISNEIEPDKKAFSTYGYDPDLVAGQWFDAGLEIPLRILLHHQFQLRPRCIAQAYTLQTSFLRHIELTLGRDAIRHLAYARDIQNEESFRSYLGDSFSWWVRQWKHSLLKRYAKIPHHLERGHQWRTQTPISEMYICKKGIDF